MLSEPSCQTRLSAVLSGGLGGTGFVLWFEGPFEGTLFTLLFSGIPKGKPQFWESCYFRTSPYVVLLGLTHPLPISVAVGLAAIW